MKDPTKVAAKWKTNFGNASQAITDGVNAVTVAPGQAAAMKKSKWLARVTASADKWAKNVSAVTLEQWKSQMLTIGLQRLATGAQTGEPKVTAFMTSFLAYLDRNKATIDAMPTDTIDQALAKANAQARYNAAYPGYR